MKKIILSLMFVLFASMAIASVSAVDTHNGYTFHYTGVVQHEIEPLTPKCRVVQYHLIVYLN